MPEQRLADSSTTHKYTESELETTKRASESKRDPRPRSGRGSSDGRRQHPRTHDFKRRRWREQGGALAGRQRSSAINGDAIVGDSGGRP